ncbi:hypothetical protein [Paenibacillus durus]|uniref:hypothetical protein n=1 Tax=Paenibacillus durus TaxID=44251 RepID=UPI0006937041|nr:hypothetical protein [Paenibacillus durus]
MNLAFLMKHGLYKAADKLANGRNIAALDELEDALKAGGTGEVKYLTDPAAMRQYSVPPKDGFDALVERKYIEIRKVGLEDVKTVAKNTGLTEEQVAKMKEHLFLTIHDLSVEGQPYNKLYFQADSDVVYAWQLAQKRELTKKIGLRDWQIMN